MSLERSKDETVLIKEMRGYLRRMKHIIEEIDCFDTIMSSNDAETFPKVRDKLRAAEKTLREANDL